MSRIELECCHADTCVSCYWRGHHLPHISIPVYKNMSLKSIKDALRDELRFGYVCGNNDDARLLSSDFVQPEDEILADQLTKAAYAAINRLKPNKKGQRKFFTGLEEVDDEVDDLYDPVYAYFVFVRV